MKQEENKNNNQMEQSQQELMFKLSYFEQHMNQIQQQLRAVEQAILEMGDLNLGLEELKGKTGTEIMAPIGRGIFVKAKLASEELTVDIGNRNLVKKSIEDTRKLISEQVDKLHQAKHELNNNLEQINSEMESLVLSSQKMLSQ